MKKRERLTFTSLSFLRGIEAVSGKDVSNTFRNHIHHTSIMGTVQKGVRIISHGDGKERVSEGELFFFNPGQVHACASGEEGGHSYRLLSIAPEVLTRLASQISEKAEAKIHFKAVHGTDEEISRGINTFFELLEDPACSDFHKESFLYELIAKVLFAFADEPLEVCCVGPQDTAMERVQKYIQAHYAEALSLATLSSVACLSPFHFQRLFTGRYGISPHQYLTHHRIFEAKKLLQNGCSLADSALATGFSDQSHFTHNFKRIVGTTPGRFKKMPSMTKVAGKSLPPAAR